MLLVIRTNSTVVGTTPMHRRIALLYLLGDFQMHLARAAVEGDVVGDQDFLEPMSRAALMHPHAALLEHDLGIHPA